jgi:hypothetical protein
MAHLQLLKDGEQLLRHEHADYVHDLDARRSMRQVCAWLEAFGPLLAPLRPAAPELIPLPDDHDDKHDVMGQHLLEGERRDQFAVFIYLNAFLLQLDARVCPGVAHLQVRKELAGTLGDHLDWLLHLADATGVLALHHRAGARRS